MFSALWQEICNDIVAAGGRFVNGEMLFQMELPEAVEALRKCIKVAVTFKSTYFDYKARAGTACPANPWRFQNGAIFGRLDAFLERLHDLLEIMVSYVQFNKLEKVEVGGTKGFWLTQVTTPASSHTCAPRAHCRKSCPIRHLCSCCADVALLTCMHACLRNRMYERSMLSFWR